MSYHLYICRAAADRKIDHLATRALRRKLTTEEKATLQELQAHRFCKTLNFCWKRRAARKGVW